MQFSAGEFAGGSLTKPLALRGNRAGVDARTRTPGATTETVLRGSGAAQALIMIPAAASGSSVDGFTITGNRSGSGVGGTGILVQAATAGGPGPNTVTNNIVTDNSIGVYPDTVVETRITRNQILANTNGGNPGPSAGDAIYGERARNLTISENRFEGNVDTVVLPAQFDSSDVEFSGNQITGEGSVVFLNINGVQVSGNTWTGGSGSAVYLADGLRNVRVLGNTITGKATSGAVTLANFGGEQTRDVEISQNTITGTSGTGTGGNAIQVGDMGAAGQVTVTRNRLVDNAGDGLRNQDPDAEINARQNWWGCNNGPGFSGCDDVTNPDGGSNPDFTPWLTLSLAADPPAVAVGTTLLARLANLSSGPLADGPFFGSAQASFDAVPQGVFAPPVAPLGAGDLTARTVFTPGGATTAHVGGPPPRAAQQETELSTTVDNETVTITATDPPAPDVVPAVVPSDRTLTPGQKAAIVIRLVNRGNSPARRLRACLRVGDKLDLDGKRCKRIARLRAGQTIVYRVRARVRRGVCRGRLAHRIHLRVAGQPPRVRRAVARILARRCSQPPAVTG